MKSPKHLLRSGLALLAAVALATAASAAPVADSIGEFSSLQGQDGWSYGYFDTTANGAYSSAGFVEFALFDVPTSRWMASAAQVGAQNNVYLSLDMLGGHPNGIGPDDQDANIWAVRRYTSEVAGPVRVDFDLHKVNTQNTNAGGITGHIFVDGALAFTQFIANDDGSGVQGSLLLNVMMGTQIDFAIDPTGLETNRDGTQSARADGSQFSARISTRTVAEPGALALAAVALGGLLAAAAPRRQFVFRRLAGIAT